MNLHAKPRLIGLAAGIALMGLAIAFMTVKSQRQANELRARLNQVGSESFRIADQFGDLLRQVNDALYRYGADHLPADREAFTRASDGLNRWIDEQKPKLSSDTERSLMQQIDTAYDDYLLAASEFETHLQANGPQAVTLGDFSSVMKVSQRLFTLGQSLAQAHFASRARVVAEAGRTLGSLRALVLVSLGGLFVFGAALAWVVYRDLIAPLQTRLVESQTLLERQEKLASLGLLASGVAHEIRNPLTAIKAALFIQQKQLQPGTQEFDDAKIVEREILRLERIVNDFLLFARPSEPQFATIPAAAPLQEVQALLAPQLATAGIRLVLDESPPVRIRADVAQLKQVLINLVQNAADAIGENGEVKLRARPDRKRLGDGDQNVVILEVADNGKGISPDVQKRLFDPFFSTKETGTGLGLSIAAGIVQKHGGALRYQTRVNHGTTFGILLPRVYE
jgi:signal transduction histidine kinase